MLIYLGSSTIKYVNRFSSPTIRYVDHLAPNSKYIECFGSPTLKYVDTSLMTDYSIASIFLGWRANNSTYFSVG
jgi:hypothetical protein